MKKIIVIGSSGYLGTAITDLASRTYPVIATFRKAPCPVNTLNTHHVYLDFENQQSVTGILQIINPFDIVIIASNVEYASSNETALDNYHELLFALKREGIKTSSSRLTRFLTEKKEILTRMTLQTLLLVMGSRNSSLRG